MRERLVRRPGPGPPPAPAPAPAQVTNSTENPLWIDNYVKPYEEQELSMRLASDSESPARLSAALANHHQHQQHQEQPNPYATIQKPARRALPSIHIGDEVMMGESNDYATLESPYHGVHARNRRASGPSGPQIPGIQPSGSTSFILPVILLFFFIFFFIPSFTRLLLFVLLTTIYFYTLFSIYYLFYYIFK